jgi:phosphomannomutase
LDAPGAEALREAFPGAVVTAVDGVRLDFVSRDARGRAWVHVRASNTEPIVRVIAEAPTEAESAAILDRAEAIVRNG